MVNLRPQEYPAAAGYIVNLVMAAIIAFKVLPAGTAHAAGTAVVALTSLVVAFMVHPFVLGAATGAFQTLIVAVSGFGFHFTDEQTAAVIGIFGLVAAVVTHTLVIPAAAARKGATVAELEARRRAGTAT